MVATGGRTTPTTQPQKTGFLQGDNRNNSSMRLSFVALIASIVFGLTSMLHKGAGVNGLYITFGFLLSAFAPKALQKFAIKKDSLSKPANATAKNGMCEEGVCP